ncbi:MAG: hypothetical protein GC154_06675 [bacterium]|nr:hypothetical protein [bacterium]
MSKKALLLIFCGLIGLAVLPMQIHAQKALFYETFEEFGVRNGGNILPAGEERTRFGGRLPSTEMEIEAPAGVNTVTTSLARWIPDPTGLSLTALFLDDQDESPGDNSNGADGAVSLFESILLDRGDISGHAVVSWMAIARQTDQPGGAMFPETDTRIDRGPEGLNLIGFGGVFRDFDTGEPLRDFSGELTLNAGANAQLESLGVSYEAGAPVFFTLDFNLERSLYDLYINGVLVRESIPFFGIDGESGSTLRELELISTARGMGAFIYDNIFQIDPDSEYQPVPFQTPAIAEDAPFIPLYIEEFDDDQLGTIAAEEKADLYGSRTLTTGVVEVAVDESQLSLARSHLFAGSSITAQFTLPDNLNDDLRYSFVITPGMDSSTTVSLGGHDLLHLAGDGQLSIDTNADDSLESQDRSVIAGLPHWIVIGHSPLDGRYNVTVYRAQSESDAQTAVLEFSGRTTSGAFNELTFDVAGNSVYLDNITVVENNENPNGDEANVYRAIVHENLESAARGESRFGGTVGEDPTQWSLNALQAGTETEISLLSGAAISRSARIAWSVIPNQTSIECSVLSVRFGDETRRLAALLADGTFGIDTDGDGLLESTGLSYTQGIHNTVQVIMDLEAGVFQASVNSSDTLHGALTGNTLTLTGAALSGQPGGGVLYDDLLVVADHYAAEFAPEEYTEPILPGNVKLLFQENFENNPAMSDRRINEFNSRLSGLPIPTQSNGVSDMAMTDIPGTFLTVGSPSADAIYVADPDGGSLYSLLVNDDFKPTGFTDFELALPIDPISTLRTVPYSLVIPELGQSLESRYVTLQWSAQAKQTNAVGLTLFTDTQVVDVPVPRGPFQFPAPDGAALVGFGGDGTLWINNNGVFGSSGMAYEANRTYRFILNVDRQSNTYSLRVNENTVLSDYPLSVDASAEGFLQTFGWFSTLVSDGDGTALQQSVVGGGAYIIDDISVWESDRFTEIRDFRLY